MWLAHLCIAQRNVPHNKEQKEMQRPIFRVLVGLLSIIFVAVGVSLAVMYDELWRKFCSSTIAVAGIFYGFYAIRGKKDLVNRRD
jgi:hypothetical protein